MEREERKRGCEVKREGSAYVSTGRKSVSQSVREYSEVDGRDQTPGPLLTSPHAVLWWHWLALLGVVDVQSTTLTVRRLGTVVWTCERLQRLTRLTKPQFPPSFVPPTVASSCLVTCDRVDGNVHVVCLTRLHVSYLLASVSHAVLHFQQRCRNT